MRTIHYILVLLFISTTYIFSQSEKNELKKVDTVIVSRIDTVVITRVDTIIVDEFISIGDKVVVDDCKKTGMISAKLGVGLFMGATSFSLDIPAGCNKTIIPKYINAGGGMNDANFKRSFFGLGLGFVTKRTDNFICKLNMCAGVMSDLDKREIGIGGGVGVDILFKIFKPCYFSISPDFNTGRYGSIGVIFLGINIVY
jgi:hypothetical protein